MASTNTTGLELAFNELIDELSKVRDLVSLAESYRDKADIVSSSLERFLTIANQKCERLEETVFNENSNISEIISNLNILQSSISSQINSVCAEVVNSVSNVKELLSLYNEQIDGLGQAISSTHNQNLSTYKALSELILKHQSTCLDNLVSAIDSVKNHMSSIKDILLPILEWCKKAIVETTADVLSKLEIYSDAFSKHIDESKNELFECMSEVQNDIDIASKKIITGLSHSKEEIIQTIDNKSAKLGKDVISLTESVQSQNQSIKKNNDAISSASELIKESIESIYSSRDTLIGEVTELAGKMFDWLHKQSEDIYSVKKLITQSSNSIQQDVQFLKSQIQEDINDKYRSLHTNQVEVNNNLSNLETELLNNFISLSEKIDKNSKVTKWLLITILILTIFSSLFWIYIQWMN